MAGREVRESTVRTDRSFARKAFVLNLSRMTKKTGGQGGCLCLLANDLGGDDLLAVDVVLDVNLYYHMQGAKVKSAIHVSGCWNLLPCSTTA